MERKKKEVKVEKPKNIVGRHLSEDGTNVKILAALIELEDMIRALGNRVGDIEDRVTATEEALAFFAKWYNRTQEVNILVPEKYVDPNPNKIIM